MKWRYCDESSDGGRSAGSSFDLSFRYLNSAFGITSNCQRRESGAHPIFPRPKGQKGSLTAVFSSIQIESSCSLPFLVSIHPHLLPECIQLSLHFTLPIESPVHDYTQICCRQPKGAHHSAYRRRDTCGRFIPYARAKDEVGTSASNHLILDTGDGTISESELEGIEDEESQ